MVGHLPYLLVERTAGLREACDAGWNTSPNMESDNALSQR